MYTSHLVCYARYACFGLEAWTGRSTRTQSQRVVSPSVWGGDRTRRGSQRYRSRELTAREGGCYERIVAPAVVANAEPTDSSMERIRPNLHPLKATQNQNQTLKATFQMARERRVGKRQSTAGAAP